MFEKIYHNNRLLGHRYSLPDGFAFFGSREFKRDDFSKHFPDFKFFFVKQVHSNKVVERTEELIEADAHWGREENQALVIQTADCLPVMIHTPDRLIAVHAGWRGIESKILISALEILDRNQPSPEVVCGPFISEHSFEVGKDVADRLANSDPSGDTNSILKHQDPDKRRIDLKIIARNQIRSIFPNCEPRFLGVDTFTSPAHCSYRRDGANAGRLFSFIVRTKTFQSR